MTQKKRWDAFGNVALQALSQLIRNFAFMSGAARVVGHFLVKLVVGGSPFLAPEISRLGGPDFAH